MVALTRDFHVLASRVTTGFSAVFLSVCDARRSPFGASARVTLRKLTHPRWSVSSAASSRLIACRSPNLASPLARGFPRFYGPQYNAMKSQVSVG
jgi:hypothetical protein